MNAPILNVIFHGTFVFCKKKKVSDSEPERIDVYMPAVPTHLFIAGNWLGETKLEGGAEYELKGVLDPEAGTTVTLPEAANLVVGKPHSDKIGTKLHAKLRMPQPDSIVTPRSAPVPNTRFKHKNESNPAMAQPLIDALLTASKYQGRLGSITVFTYRFADVADLRLVRTKPPGGGHPWIPVASGPTPEQPFGTVNLHMFSAHEVEDDLEEAQTAFDRMTELFDDFPLGLNRTNLDAELLPNDQLPKGLAKEECEDLSLRTQRMAKLGRLRKNGLDLNNLWLASEGFNSEPSGCTCCFCC